MSIEYLDKNGLNYLMNKIKPKDAEEDGTDISLITTGERYKWDSTYGQINDNGDTDSIPYVYRQTGGDSKAGNLEKLEEIVGGTVVWNQICNDSSVTVPNNRKYYMIKSGTASIGVSDGSAITGLTSGTDIVIDLTAMFGSTIADYIYSLEQAHAGDGVAFFRKLFPKDYYEYDAGTLKSVENLQSHDVVGFNQWDEEWEVGDYDRSGQKRVYNSRIRCKNLIPVLPNTTYYFMMGTTSGVAWCSYDGSGAFISSASRAVGQGGFTIPTPENCYFLAFGTWDAYGSTYNHDICINIFDPAKNGTYEPYQKRSYPLDSSLTLLGVPKLDAANKLYYDGDTYEADGTVTRRYGIVDLGTLTWAKFDRVAGTDWYFTTTDISPAIKLVSSTSDISNGVICPKYTPTSGANHYNNTTSYDKTMAVWVTNNLFSIVDLSYTDAAAFKAAMSGVYLVYELAIPITESAQPYQELQECDPAGTEEFVYNDDVSVEIPVGHTTKYISSISDKVDTLTDTVKEQENIGFYIDEDGDLCQR